jgi:ribosome biogenesis GTPase
LADNRVYECKARGIFRKDDMTPLPGDVVEISITDDEKDLGSIDQINPRQSELIRPAVANVDQIALVLALRSPSPDFVLLDKMLIAARLNNIEPIICLNKIDLCDNEECQRKAKAYEGTGHEVIL